MSELGDDARALIDATQDGDDPSPADRARMRARLFGSAAALGVAATSAQAKAAGGGAGLAGAGLGGAGKLVLGVAVLAVGVGTSIALQSARAPDAGPRSVAPSVAKIVAPQAQQPVAQGEHPTEAARSAQPAREATSVAPRATETWPAQRKTASSVRRSRREPAAVPNTTALAGSPQGDAAEGSSLGLELSLLGSAQLALQARDFDRALALLRRHAERFPEGALVPERFAAQAIALCGTGQYTLGQEQLAALARKAPSSPLAQRARAACK